MSGLEAAAHCATIVAAIPVAGAALMFIWRRLKGPRGLVIRQISALPGDPGFFVEVWNGGDEPQSIKEVGVIPANKLPVLQIKRSIQPKPDGGNASLFSVMTTMADGPVNLEPRRQLRVLTPTAFHGDLNPFEIDSLKAQIERWQSWYVATGTSRVTPFVILEDGAMLLGRSQRMRKNIVTGGVPPVCECGHFVGVHDFRAPGRMRRREPKSRCDECRCVRFQGSPKKSLAALDEGELFALPHCDGTSQHPQDRN